MGGPQSRLPARSGIRTVVQYSTVLDDFRLGCSGRVHATARRATVARRGATIGRDLRQLHPSTHRPSTASQCSLAGLLTLPVPPRRVVLAMCSSRVVMQSTRIVSLGRTGLAPFVEEGTVGGGIPSAGASEIFGFAPGGWRLTPVVYSV